MNRRLGILISGRGTNLQALIDAIHEGRLDAHIGIVISNRAEASGLERARAARIPTQVINHRAFSPRESFERALVAALREHDIGLVCLAGFMRLVGAPLLE